MALSSLAGFVSLGDRHAAPGERGHRAASSGKRPGLLGLERWLAPQRSSPSAPNGRRAPSPAVAQDPSTTGRVSVKQWINIFLNSANSIGSLSA